jgi:hypothetical protein|tara:strand:+ start:515 stop:874 length:360 start_codon:yes stop_codon:yes gene_type:complete
MKFRSGLEEQIAKQLTDKGIDYTYESTKVNYQLQCVYTPDFLIPSTGIHLEAKGYFSSKDRRKMLAVKECNPELDIRMIFQRPFNKLYKGSKSTYAMWCERHEIPWASFNNIPKEWINP